MAKLLEMEEWVFIQEYTRLRPQRDGLALKDKANGECIFLEGRDCRVQEAKPVQGLSEYMELPRMACGLRGYPQFKRRPQRQNPR